MYGACDHQPCLIHQPCARTLYSSPSACVAISRSKALTSPRRVCDDARLFRNQPRSSAHTQQQWREWREWEDALTAALEKRTARGETTPGEGAEPAGPDASCNEDSTVCNSPWSSERGGGGSFGGGGGSLRASSAHGEGDVAGGYRSSRFRCRSGTAPDVAKDTTRVSRTRGRTSANRDSPGRKRGWWTWRSYSPPSSISRQKSADALRKLAMEKKAAIAFGLPANGGAPSPSASVPYGPDPPDGAGGSKPVESIVRASGGYLPPRHPLANLQLSPACTQDGGALGAADPGVVDAGVEGELSSGGEGAPTLSAAPGGRGLRARGAARTLAKGPAGDGSMKLTDLEVDPAPTEEKPALRPAHKAPRSSSDDAKVVASRRSRSLSGVLSGLADWLMPGMDGASSRRRRAESGDELILEVYPTTPTDDRGGLKSAPPTPRGRVKASAMVRGGGWFYNGDSDYSTEEEDGNFDSDDEGFWADAGTIQPPEKSSSGEELSILDRLRRLFT